MKSEVGSRILVVTILWSDETLLFFHFLLIKIWSSWALAFLA